MGEGDRPTVLDYRVPDKPTAMGDRMVAWLGGWRQVLFAFGLALLMGGLGTAIERKPVSGEGSILMFIGGLIVGLIYPVPRRRPPAE